MRISSDSIFSDTPRISVAGDTVHIIWYGTDFFGTGTHSGVQYIHSFDGGQTFTIQQTISSSDTAYSSGFISSSGANVYILFPAAIDTFQGIALIRSTDAGTTWLPIQRLLNKRQPQFIEARDPDIYIHYFAPDSNIYGMLHSANNGATWQRLISAMPPLNSMLITETKLHGVNSSGPDPKDVIYYYSTNSGISWVYSDMLSAEDFTSSLYPKISGNGRNEMYVVWNDTGTIKMRRTRNNGVSWLPEINLSQQPGAVFPDIAAGHEFVSAVWDNNAGGIGTLRVRPSNDFGASFCPLDTPTSDSGTGVPAIKISGNNVHLVWSQFNGVSGEIFYRHGTVQNNPDVVDRPPEHFSLKQNYPNPFNGTTHINYDVSIINNDPTLPSLVKLTVYNLLGQEVETLVNTKLLPGRYDVVFDAYRIASGVYFYQLQTGQFIERRKLMILR
jgi:hypothetical protein